MLVAPRALSYNATADRPSFREDPS
jgi:hypothetical protein